jgi:DNA-binding PadR family transcriptional regulator
MKWLESGTRRDLCLVLYREGEQRGQALKTTLERHYGSPLDSRRFYDRMDALVSAGHVELRVDGLHDVYALTDAGEERLREHCEWVAECVEAGADRADEGERGERDEDWNGNEDENQDEDDGE